MRLLGFAAFAAFAVLASSSAARAESTIITIRGEACDLTALEANLTETLASKSVGDSHVSVVTRGSAPALSADVLFVDADGQSHGPRVVPASTCDELFDAIALVIVMAIPDPDATAPLSPPDVARAPAPPTTSPSIDRVAIVRSTPAGARTHLALDGFVGGSSSVTSRGLNEQLLFGARVRIGHGSLSLQARLDAPEEARVSQTGKVTVTQAELSVAPCVHRGSLAGCAVASVGVVHGSGETLSEARDASTPVVAAGLRVGWERFVSDRLAIRVHVDARALLTTTRFDVDYMPVWRSSRFEGSAGVGLLARFL